MAAVTLLTYAAQTETVRDSGGAGSGGFIASGSSTPLDCSTHAVLRQVIRCDVNHGSTPQAELYIETGPTSSGPWTVAWSKHMRAGCPPGNEAAWNSAPRAVIATDAFARVRWSVRGGPEGLSLSLGCTGTGIGSGA